MSACCCKEMLWRLVAPRQEQSIVQTSTRRQKLSKVGRELAPSPAGAIYTIYYRMVAPTQGFGRTTNSASVKTVFACHRETCHVQAKGSALGPEKMKDTGYRVWKGEEVPVE